MSRDASGKSTRTRRAASGDTAPRATVHRLDTAYDGRDRRDAVPPAVLDDPGMNSSLPPARPGLEEDLEQLRSVTFAMGEMVEVAIDRAVEALLKRDVAVANEVIRNDARINELQSEVRQLAFTAILTQQPVARDLRESLGFQHMASELERMADHAVNVARVARDLADLPPLDASADIPRLGRQVALQVREILVALVAHDVDQARAVAARDERVNRMYRRILDELVRLIAADPENAYRGANLILVCQNLERIGDRVTNLAEDLVFLETGATEELG